MLVSYFIMQVMKGGRNFGLFWNYLNKLSLPDKAQKYYFSVLFWHLFFSFNSINSPFKDEIMNFSHWKVPLVLVQI